VSSALEEAVASKAFEGIERWRPDDVLDLYKIAVDPRVVGNVKEVKSYRNWVAHGKKSSRPGRDIDPRTAYDRLTDFLSALRA